MKKIVNGIEVDCSSEDMEQRARDEAAWAAGAARREALWKIDELERKHTVSQRTLREFLLTGTLSADKRAALLSVESAIAPEREKLKGA